MFQTELAQFQSCKFMSNGFSIILEDQPGQSNAFQTISTDNSIQDRLGANEAEQTMNIS